MMFDQWPESHSIFKRLAKALIRLRVCTGCSEALLVAHTTLLEMPWLICVSWQLCHKILNIQVACKNIADVNQMFPVEKNGHHYLRAMALAIGSLL